MLRSSTNVTTPIACVVVNFGSADLLAQNLAPIGADTSTRVTIVDNFSTDTERRRVLRLAGERGWKLVASSGNPGFGYAANAGVAAALHQGAQVICLLNPDACISPQDLRRLASVAQADRNAIISPRIVTDEGQEWFTGARLDTLRGRTFRAAPTSDGRPESTWLTGACMVFHADAWQLTGGFDPDYFLYWEDVDLSWRHVAAGGRLLYEPGITVRHSVGGTQRQPGRSGRSSLYYYYNCRNRLLFAAKNLDRRTQMLWAFRSLGYAFEVLLRGGRRQFLRPWRPISAATAGSWSGLVRIARSP